MVQDVQRHVGTVKLHAHVTAQQVCVQMGARKAGGVTVAKTQIMKMVLSNVLKFKIIVMYPIINRHNL